VPPDHYRDTPARDAITGIAGFVDHVLVITHNRVYQLQGYGADDFVIHQRATGIGCISHHSICYDRHGRVWWWGQDGPYMYDGSFHFMGGDLLTYIKEDYAANRSLYEDMVAVIDHKWRVVKFMLPQWEAGPTTWYVGAIQGIDPVLLALGQSLQPAWSFDVQARAVSGMGGLVDTGDSEEYYHGGADGILRLTNVEDDADDAGDDREKEVIVRTGHLYVGGDQSGNIWHGSRLVGMNVFFSSIGDTEVQIFSGDDGTHVATTPSWGPHTLGPTITGGKTERTDRFVPFRNGPTGAGHTVEFRAVGSTHWQYRGLSFKFKPGGKAQLNS
jgi:hypothetical protein